MLLLRKTLKKGLLKGIIKKNIKYQLFKTIYFRRFTQNKHYILVQTNRNAHVLPELLLSNSGKLYTKMISVKRLTLHASEYFLILVTIYSIGNGYYTSQIPTSKIRYLGFIKSSQKNPKISQKNV